MAENTQNTEMKNLGNLSPAKGSNKTKKRLGRGIGSGLGKTAGKGHKGQKARKSGGVRPGFEGGQMKLYMRLPKRGFKTPDRQQWNEVNLDQLNKFEAGAPINPETLAARGLLRFRGQPVKLLGRGSLDKNLQITVHKASESAKAAVEKAGGKLEELGLPTPQPIKRAKKSKK